MCQTTAVRLLHHSVPRCGGLFLPHPPPAPPRPAEKGALGRALHLHPLPPDVRYDTFSKLLTSALALQKQPSTPSIFGLLPACPDAAEASRSSPFVWSGLFLSSSIPLLSSSLRIVHPGHQWSRGLCCLLSPPLPPTPRPLHLWKSIWHESLSQYIQNLQTGM